MYFFIIALILILYCVRWSGSSSIETDKNDKIYCFLICFALVFIAAFRADEGMADTAGYRLDYEQLSHYTFDGLIYRYGLYYIGYFGLSKIFSMAGMPVWIWFGFVEFIYLFALTKFINRFSRDKIFSLLVFTTIGLFSFSLAGMKQTLAMSFVMFSFLFFVDKKYVPAAALVVLTYFTHQSALIFLGAFGLYVLRNRKYFVQAVIVLCVLIYVYSFAFMETMVEVMGNEKWEQYMTDESDYSFTTFIFLLTITLISLFGYKNYSNEEPNNAKLVFSLSLIAAAIQLLARMNGSLFRLALLYMPFTMILLPNACYYAPDNKKRILKFILMGCIIFYCLYTSRNSIYEFIFF